MTEPTQSLRRSAHASRVPAEAGELRFFPLEADNQTCMRGIHPREAGREAA